MKECIICKNKSELTVSIQLNKNTSFCLSSSSYPICENCIDDNLKETSVGDFIKIDGVLYHGNLWQGTFNSVSGEQHLDRIFNREYYSIKALLNDY